MRGYRQVTLLIFGSLLLGSSVETLEAQIRFTNVATWPGYSRGEPNALAIAGDYAYATIGIGGLAVLDISNSTNPVRVATYDLSPDVPYDVAVKDGYAYVMGNSLHVLDISHPTAPVEVSRLYRPAYNQQISIENDKLYLIAWGGLDVIDVSDPYFPVLLGHHPISNVGYGAHASVKDGLAYVAAGYDVGVVVVDVSDPANMVTMRSFAINDNPRDLQFRGNYAFVAVEGGLMVVDVSDPVNPVRVWRSDRNSFVIGNAISLAGDYAYVASGDGLLVFDISNPTNVVTLGKHETARWVVDVVVRGTYAHTIVEREGLEIIDVSNPLQPELAGRSELSGYSDDVQKVGDFLFVSDRIAGLRIMELSAAGLNEVGRFRPTRGEVLEAKIIGSYAYLACNEGGLQIVDISNPRNPVLLGKSQPWYQCLGLDVAGNYAYLGFGDRLMVVDIHDPRNPVPMPNPYTNSSTWRLTVRGDYAYIPAYDKLLAIVNISDPSHPVEVSTITNAFLSPGAALELRDQYAYILSYYQGLTIVDVSQPANPVVRGRYSTSAGGGLDVVGNHAFICSYNGVEVVDISNATRPVLVGRTTPLGLGGGITVESDRIYLAAGTTGVHIIDYTLLPPPRLRIRSDRRGEVTVTIENTFDQPYRVETSTSLRGTSWQPFISVHQPGAVTFKDTTFGPGRKFYRIVQ